MSLVLGENRVDAENKAALVPIALPFPECRLKHELMRDLKKAVDVAEGLSRRKFVRKNGWLATLTG